ncbi:Oidioi.mRNA.OKI2018_I69.chr1.g573.t1.cds [Oikopleura dioica]|uniref:Oidioi.mRNA.OKI2018_I69.chr1.g573.t1.cds n=1 Tax=Oikopleura dioica TaxID=34765 RepID=A0ABN7SKA3_OIKDI|nr:Oidioi.mRNA.OKI2018_I69.chr1.g573.t1.cds [Oikopleura dioica]
MQNSTLEVSILTDMANFEYDSKRLDQNVTRGRFKDEVAIVCGGASGIGRATVKRFLNDGAKVAVFDLNGDNDFGDENVKVYQIDCSKKEDCETSVSSVISDFGKINHLVYSVAYFGSKALDATEEDWSKSLMINVAGAGFMISAVTPHLEKAEERRRSVCLLTSISSTQAQWHRWTYGATKGALWSLVRHATLELGEKGIRVNSVSPSWIWTPEVAKAYPEKSEINSPSGPGQLYHSLGRVGEVDEVAAAICFLASRDAGFIHGHDLQVGGGYHAMGPEGCQPAKFAGSTDS